MEDHPSRRYPCDPRHDRNLTRTSRFRQYMRLSPLFLPHTRPRTPTASIPLGARHREWRSGCGGSLATDTITAIRVLEEHTARKIRRSTAPASANGRLVAPSTSPAKLAKVEFPVVCEIPFLVPNIGKRRLAYVSFNKVVRTERFTPSYVSCTVDADDTQPSLTSTPRRNRARFISQIQFVLIKVSNIISGAHSKAAAIAMVSDETRDPGNSHRINSKIRMAGHTPHRRSKLDLPHSNSLL